MVFRRHAGHDRKFCVLLEQDNGLASGRGCRLGRDNPHEVVDLYAGRELAREIEERFNLLDTCKCHD